jgi:hypothetical protein
MALADAPAVATKIIKFDGDPGITARLDYNVEMPGSLRGRRITELTELGIEDADWAPSSKARDVDLAAEVGLRAAGAGFDYDREQAIALWLRMARAAGVRGDHIGEVERWLASPRLQEQLSEEGRRKPRPLPEEEPRERDPRDRDRDSEPLLPEVAGSEIERRPLRRPPLADALDDYLEGLKSGAFKLPAPDGSGGATTTVVRAPADTSPPEPALFLVEVYAISWFPAAYGLGKTVKTITLLPGEEMTIHTRTWRSSELTVKESTSIFDSHSTEASDRFRSAVQSETTDKQTQSSSRKWHVEANASASWGFGSASVKAGASGEYQASREQFAKQVNDASQEHAQQASSKRDTTVTSSTERIEKREDEETIERVIRNVNLRRTVNFVFRELNQRYVTKVHLIEVKIAFTNGTPGTWREVPISGLRRLLGEKLQEWSKVDEVATEILGLIGVVFDKDETPVSVLEKVTLKEHGDAWERADAKRDANGHFPAPTPDVYYRFKRGPLAQDADQTVPGVVVVDDDVVLRTDGLVVEGLLGEADALDEYAMISQKADAETKALQNVRADIVNRGLNKIDDGAKLAAAYAEIVHSNGAVKVELEQHQNG